MGFEGSAIRTLLEEMRRPPNDIEGGFYVLMLSADDSGRSFVKTHTRWVDFVDGNPRAELREASLVTIRMAEHWASIGTPGVFIHNLDHLTVFFLRGGNALIVPAVAETSIPDLLAPEVLYRTGHYGFVSGELADPSVLAKKPTNRLRMKVIERDKARCRICGRRPDDHVDLELEVHHIRPWKDYGVTDMANLITLCRTCHRGLDPHFAPWLFEYIEPRGTKANSVRFIECIANYQRVTMLQLEEASVG